MTGVAPWTNATPTPPPGRPELPGPPPPPAVPPAVFRAPDAHLGGLKPRRPPHRPGGAVVISGRRKQPGRGVEVAAEERPGVRGAQRAVFAAISEPPKGGAVRVGEPLPALPADRGGVFW